MSRSATKVVGITLGDPAGIGPEVTAKMLSKTSFGKGVRFLVIGDELSFKKYSFSRFKQIDYCAIPSFKTLDYVPGKPTALSGEMSFRFLKKSVELVKDKFIRALVTAPLSKQSVCAFKPGFVGHTEYFATAFGVKKFDMMFVTDQLKTIIVTRHVPLVDVPRLITVRKVLESILLVHKSLKNQFKIKHPHIAVCGLNPHAGEGGKIGKEESKRIVPAIKYAVKKGVNVEGPYASDTIFLPERRREFDAIVSMYHDQGLIAMKTLFFSSVVNLTIGLPFVRTSPAHGTAFDIAGRNKADASSMIQAVKLAVHLS